MIRSLPVAILSLAALVFAGCRGTALKPTPADRLREQVQSLEIEVDRLSMRNRELESALAEATMAAPKHSIDPEAAAAQAHLARIGIGSASVIRIAVNDPSLATSPGTLTVYLEPMDGRGRFLQVTGRVSIQASMLVEGGDPIRIGERSFSPGDVRDAWRSGFMGTHYTFEMPVEVPANAIVGTSEPQASVLVVFRDAIGGGEFSRLVTVPIDLPDGSSSTAAPEGSR